MLGNPNTLGVETKEDAFSPYFQESEQFSKIMSFISVADPILVGSEGKDLDQAFDEGIWVH